MIQHLETLIDCLFSHSKMDRLTRNCFDKYYMPLVKIKYFNPLIGTELFFDQPVKNQQEAQKELVEMSRNNYYTTGNLLDFLHYQKYYKLISIDLSRQTNTSTP